MPKVSLPSSACFYTHSRLACGLYELTHFRKALGAPLGAQMTKNLPTVQEMWVRSLGGEDPLMKGVATHSSILAWRIRGQRSLVGYSPWGCKQWDMTTE